MSDDVTDSKPGSVFRAFDRRQKKNKPRLPVWKKTLFAGCIFAVFAAIALAGLEFTLYLRYPTAEFNGRRNGFRYTWGHKVVENRYGFREREFEVPKPHGTFRVMVLGDSFTWGAGLATEERYTSRLEASLRQRHPDRRIEVLNFALSGCPTTVERDVLRTYVDEVDPDLVVIGFCINDTQPRSQRYSPEAAKYDLLFQQIHRLRYLGFGRSSAFLDFRLWSGMESLGLVPRWQDALQRTYEKDSPEWQQFVAALRDVRSICDRRRLPPPIFIVLNQGTSAAQPTDYEHPDEELQLYLKWYHQVEAAAAEAGMIVADVEEEFRREMAGEPMGVNPLDGHPSAKCNLLFAQKLDALVEPFIAPPEILLTEHPQPIRDGRVRPAAYEEKVKDRATSARSPRSSPR